MGWDIVAIGTNHRLPIENPIETAKMLTPILNGTISIGYYQEWQYNKFDGSILSSNSMLWREISTLHHTGKNGKKYLLEIKNECERRILTQLTSSIESVKFSDDVEKEFFLYNISSKPFRLYEINSEDFLFEFSILKEICEFSVVFNGRWFSLEKIFREPYIGDNKSNLDTFRKHIFTQLKTCGCDCAYYFPDQSYGEYLYNKINLSSNDWLSYLRSRQYLRDNNPDLIFLDVKEYISGNKTLQQSQNAICIIDDFSDLNASK